MKLSLALIAFSSAALMACSHSSSSSGPSAPATPAIQDKDATGSVNGKSGDFSKGTYTIGQDSNGKDVYVITLSSASCQFIDPSMDGIMIAAPKAPGTYGWPNAVVTFFYQNGTTSQNDMSSNEIVKIVSDDGITLKGAVSSVDGASNVNGNFTVTNCNAQNQPPPVQPIPPTAGDPAGVQAILATNWSQVKYAFCSAQDQYGVMIDFQGADLSQVHNGSFRYATRPCDASQPFQWQPTGTFQMSSDANGNLNFDFGPSSVGVNNTIATPSSAFNQGYGVWIGNSGSCVFLTNEGTAGALPDDNCR
jgi:hypothetical protein